MRHLSERCALVPDKTVPNYFTCLCTCHAIFNHLANNTTDRLSVCNSSGKLLHATKSVTTKLFVAIDVQILGTWWTPEVPGHSCRRPGRVDTGWHNFVKLSSARPCRPVDQHKGFESNALEDRKSMQITQRRYDVFKLPTVRDQTSSYDQDRLQFFAVPSPTGDCYSIPSGNWWKHARAL